jgi:hypothetical protein
MCAPSAAARSIFSARGYNQAVGMAAGPGYVVDCTIGVVLQVLNRSLGSVKQILSLLHEVGNFKWALRPVACILRIRLATLDAT